MTKQLLWEQYKEEEGDNAYSNAQFGHYLHYMLKSFVLLFLPYLYCFPSEQLSGLLQKKFI
jgi:hypothetical protein